MNNLLSLFSILGFVIVSILVLLAAKFGTDWAKSMMDTILPMVIQCWIINFTTMMNYYFGNSARQSEKHPEDIIELTKPVQ